MHARATPLLAENFNAQCATQNDANSWRGNDLTPTPSAKVTSILAPSQSHRGASRQLMTPAYLPPLLASQAGQYIAPSHQKTPTQPLVQTLVHTLPLSSLSSLRLCVVCDFLVRWSLAHGKLGTTTAPCLQSDTTARPNGFRLQRPAPAPRALVDQRRAPSAQACSSSFPTIWTRNVRRQGRPKTMPWC